MRAEGDRAWRADRARVGDIASNLVAINSVNPSLGGPSDGEAQVAEYIRSFCDGLGLTVEVEEVLAGRPNVIASVQRGESFPTLVIEGHLDTVGAGDMADAFSPLVSNGRLRARGACDTKGGIAGALHAFEHLAQMDDIPLNVEFLGSVDEEVAFQGVLDYLSRRRSASAAIVIEPTSLIPVVAHSGLLRGELRAVGRAGHSATPAAGDNAITRMRNCLPGLELWAHERQPNSHLLTGRTSFSVTMISGGTEINIIPAECSAWFDWRLHPADDPSRACDDLKAYLDSNTESITVAISLEDFGLDTSLAEPLVAAALSASHRATGQTEAVGTRAGTDASKFSRLGGIPSVVLGPGSINQAHSVDEWVELEELALAAEMYVDICRTFAQAGVPSPAEGAAEST
jgi:acetylornithine deacetylase/succinyl-diaminopimelate desuccinylase-like protein